MATIYEAGTITLDVKSNWKNALDLGDAPERLHQTFTQQYTNGTGVNQVQIQWHDRRTLLFGEVETLDLQALSGTPFGTATFTKVKELIIINLATITAYTLLIGGAATNEFTDIVSAAGDKIKVRMSGGLRMWSPGAGFTVDGTHKNLKITNDAVGDITYDIILIGLGTIA